MEEFGVHGVHGSRRRETCHWGTDEFHGETCSSDSYGTRVTATELEVDAELEAVGGTPCRLEEAFGRGRVGYVSIDTIMYLIGPARPVASSQSISQSVNTRYSTPLQIPRRAIPMRLA